jgi:molybdopterin synthase catalytic subunit
MLVNILYFGILRERIAARREEQLQLAEHSTVQDLMDTVASRYPGLAPMQPYVRVAVNEDYSQGDRPLHEGDRIALIPPVAGGQEGSYCRLSTEPLNLNEVIDAVSGPGRGGIVTFVGVVRDHNEGRIVTHLEYEAYPPMALGTLADIIRRCEAIAPNVRVAVTHRVGDLQIGEAAVVIAAAGAHRAEAFDACRACIELLKQEVPIWKKEFAPDGEAWIGSTP